MKKEVDMPANDVLEHHKALLNTRRRTTRVTSFVFLALLIGVLGVPFLLVTRGGYQPDVSIIVMLVFLALTNAVQLGKALAEIRMYEELIEVLDVLRRAEERGDSVA
jgi:hypothetical protein